MRTLSWRNDKYFKAALYFGLLIRIAYTALTLLGRNNSLNSPFAVFDETFAESYSGRYLFHPYHLSGEHADELIQIQRSSNLTNKTYLINQYRRVTLVFFGLWRCVTVLSSLIKIDRSVLLSTLAILIDLGIAIHLYEISAFLKKVCENHFTTVVKREAELLTDNDIETTNERIEEKEADELETQRSLFSCIFTYTYTREHKFLPVAEADDNIADHNVMVPACLWLLYPYTVSYYSSCSRTHIHEYFRFSTAPLVRG